MPVMNWWASSEAGGMAISCGLGQGLHLSDDLIIVEPVDADGTPGAAGDAVGEDLPDQSLQPGPAADPLRDHRPDHADGRRPSPARADRPTGGSRTCKGGSTISSSTPASGRCTRTSSAPGSARTERSSSTRCGRRSAGRRDRDPLHGDVDLMRLQRELADDLRRLGLREPEITIRRVEHLERQATGKLKRFLPLPANAA